jgi:Fur family peroxide stress response transcriptional regulator
MKPNKETVRQRMKRFQEVCKNEGVRLTFQRITIFEAVAGSDEHPDAETIHKAVRKQIPTVSLDTVYRTLWLLHDLGLITTMGPPRERVRFDANTKPHHHFVCTRCGLARDFEHGEFDALKIPDEVRAMGNVETARVELRGVCFGCAKKG